MIMIQHLLMLTALIVATYGETLIHVNTDSQYKKVNTGDSVTLGCSFDMVDATSDAVPYVYWYKGRSVDDVDAIKVFTGHKGYQTNPDVKIYHNGYEGKASVPDLDNPDLILTNVNSTDVGRFWCLVTDYTQTSMFGMDTDSIALAVDSAEQYVYAYTETFAQTNVTQPAFMDCSVYGNAAYDMITWLVGPHHDVGTGITDPVGTYEKIGSYYYYNHCVGGTCSSGQDIEPNYSGNAFISSSGTLTLLATVEKDGARYWCRGMNMHYASSNGNQEIQTDQSSTVLQISTDLPLDCSNLSDGNYPDVNDCSKFWICYGGTTEHMSCYPGLSFDESTDTCNWPDQVCGDCSTNPNPTPC